MPWSIKKHKAIGVKQAWSIKNYRCVCNVSPHTTDHLPPRTPPPSLLGRSGSHRCRRIGTEARSGSHRRCRAETEFAVLHRPPTMAGFSGPDALRWPSPRRQAATPPARSWRDLWDFFDLFLVFVPDLPDLVFIFVPSCMYLTDLTDLGHSCMDLCDSCMVPFEIIWRTFSVLGWICSCSMFAQICLHSYWNFMNNHEELNWLSLSTKKIMCKWPELFIRVDGSMLSFLKNFLLVQRLTKNRGGSRSKNLNMCRDFFGKIISPILMHWRISTAGDRVLAP
jgi:hypothetical protein